MPILGMLERVKPAEAVALARAVLARFGMGETRRGVASELGGESPNNGDHPEHGASHGTGREDEPELRAAWYRQ
jgi:hypothetical protein